MLVIIPFSISHSVFKGLLSTLQSPNLVLVKPWKDMNKAPFIQSMNAKRSFSLWNILVIYRGTVQIGCEHEQIFVHANDRLDCPQSKLRRSHCFFAINQSAGTSLASFPQIQTCMPDLTKKKLGTRVTLLCL